MNSDADLEVNREAVSAGAEGRCQAAFFLPEFNVISPEGEYAEFFIDETQEAGPA
ncbi:hypothetical protein [Paenibacillus sp. 32O-W]|uniref:hypothetical protein n=1 Tax=Paenibacillus sp. 32O-W TaxID=1695218 RepID=UPI001C930871|nr:hypothetical protein [Paenibacillus sp. 32O-W]